MLLVILLVSILIITHSTSLLNLLAVVFSYISNPTSKNSFNAFSLLFSKVSYKYFILFLFASSSAFIFASMLAIMNPDDKAGLEAALRIKDETGAKVTVLTMGLPKADAILREAMAMGADDAVLVTDRVLGGADTWATSTTIAGALRNLDYDLIITGRQAIDGDTAQVGPQIAVHLGLPVISYAEDIKVEGDSVVVKRQYEDRYHVVKAKMPCLITALSELNEPRYMTPGGIFDAFDKEVTVWGRADLKDVDDSDLGLKGSPTKIAKASDKVPKGAGEKVNLDPTESVNYLMEKFKEKHII